MAKKIISILLVLLIVGIIFLGVKNPFEQKGSGEAFGSKPEITLWYTDDSFTDYLSDAAVTFEDAEGIKVNLKLMGGLEYLDKIQEASLSGDVFPDLYLLSTDSLEKATLAGLAAPVEDKNRIINTSFYPISAVSAVTYNDRKMAYPVYFDTAMLIVNESLVKEIAKNALESEAEENAQGEEGEGSSETSVASKSFTEEEILTKMDNIMPKSVVGILNFAKIYDTPEGVESFMEWNVNDISYNYWFAGAYMNVGGENGDNKEEIDIYNSDAMYGLSVFNDFNHFFSMESSEISYESATNDFIDGKIVFTVADLNAVEKIRKASEEGTFTGEFGIIPVGMLNSTLKSKMLSVTTAAVINGYSENAENAEKFAEYISKGYGENMYSRSGKTCALKKAEYEFPQMEQIYATYENSEALPKLLETGNYWVLAELCYSQIWNGEDVNASLKELAEKVKSEVYGEQVTETEMETPEVDEDYCREDD